MADARSLQLQVNDNIDAVTKARASGLAQLTSRFWQTEATTNAASAIRSLPIDAWAQRGREGAAKSTAPGANGWPGWIKAGDEFLRGIADLVGEGETATLANIEQSISEVPADIQRVAKKAAATTKSAAVYVGTTVGETAAAATKPILPVLGVLVAGLAALAVMKLGGKK